MSSPLLVVLDVPRPRMSGTYCVRRGSNPQPSAMKDSPTESKSAQASPQNTFEFVTPCYSSSDLPVFFPMFMFTISASRRWGSLPENRQLFFQTGP